MQRDRAWRRSQRERKIQQIYRWVHARDWFISTLGKPFEERVAAQVDYARKSHSSPAKCSGPCCGNPRKHFGHKSLSEQRFDLRCEEETKTYHER